MATDLNPFCSKSLKICLGFLPVFLDITIFSLLGSGLPISSAVFRPITTTPIWQVTLANQRLSTSLPQLKSSSADLAMYPSIVWVQIQITFMAGTFSPPISLDPCQKRPLYHNSFWLPLLNTHQ